jgi:hypothetical protein
MNLPADLVAFLKAGRQLKVAAGCETGAVSLLPLARLRVMYYPVDCQNSSEEGDDPHCDEGGCYLVPGISLLATCENCDPEGLLLWLPVERQFGNWDMDHGQIWTLPKGLTWTELASRPGAYIDAFFCAEVDGKELLGRVIPWRVHQYTDESLSEPQPE